VCSGCGVSRATALMGVLTRWRGDLGLGLFCWGFAYCPGCGGWTFLGGLGEGPFCGHAVERVLFCGGSLGGPSVAFCGYATWLAWWWIGGAFMGIPASLLSISGLVAWCYETHRFASRCLARFRGTPLKGGCESDVRRGLMCLCWSWTTPWGVGASVFSLG
jgi:hypothetical protein